MKVYIEDDNNKLFEVELNAGIVIGNKGKKKLELVVAPINKQQLTDTYDDIMSAILHLAEFAVQQQPKEAQKETRKQIYNTLVQAFSLIMDKFNPEAKDYRKDLMTPEELKAIQDSVNGTVPNKQAKSKVS